MERLSLLGLGAIALVVVTTAASSASAGITPVATASRCTTTGETCAAPLAVFFSARGTTCTTGECDDSPIENEAFHALSYEWSFGDPESGTWAASGQSRNVEYGPLAIHVFDDPGAYTVQLTVRSGNETATRAVTIHVDDPDTVWNGKTTCVSTSGTFIDCPSGAIEVTSSSYGSSVSAALATGSRRILFRGGETFFLNSTPDLPNGPGLIGSFGNGKATINGVGGAEDFVRQGSSVSDWRFHDLEILQAPSGPTRNNLIHRVGTGGSTTTNFLWYQIERLNGDEAILDIHETTGSYGSPSTFVVDSKLGASGANTNTIFFATVRGGLVGNTIGRPSGNTNHNYRIQPRFADLLIAHNDLICCSNSDTSVRGHTGGVSQFAVLRGNVVRSGSAPHGWSVWPEYSEKDARMRDIIIESNRIESGNEIPIAARSVTIRNNLLRDSNIEATTNHGCALPSSWVQDIFIYNNSGYGNGHLVDVNDFGGCRGVMGGGRVIRNNLHWGPSAPSSIVQSGYGGEVVSNNLTRANLPSNPFASSSPSIDNPSGWQLTGSGAGAAIDSGIDLGSTVMLDFANAARPAGTGFDVGAIESDADAPQPGPTPPTALAPPVLLD